MPEQGAAWSLKPFFGHFCTAAAGEVVEQGARGTWQGLIVGFLVLGSGAYWGIQFTVEHAYAYCAFDY